jgi:hypothetical protein
LFQRTHLADTGAGFLQEGRKEKIVDSHGNDFDFDDFQQADETSLKLDG